jgi:hypothetical protein
VVCCLSCASAAGADRVEAELLPKAGRLGKEERKRTAKLLLEAERIRGFKLRKHPPWSKRTNAGIYRYFTRLVHASGRGREIRLGTKLYAALGFWPADFDLVRVQLRAQSGAVGAFYTPAERAFTLVPHGPGRTSGYARVEKEAQVVHEYVHAIQDESLGLSRLKMYAGNDRGNAVRALLEGDAVLAMSIYTVGRRHGRDKERRLAYVTRETARRRKGMQAILRMPDMRKAPKVIGVNMVFPYTGGSMFVETAYRRGGWAAVNACYRTPPISTEQIIHPEKFFRKKPRQPIEDPVKIDLPDVPAAALPGARLIDVDSLGELEITVLLAGAVSNARARMSAAGWGGDRYAAYERTAGAAAGELVICWLSVWDSERDAREFFSAYSKVLARKCGVKRKVLDEGGRLVDWRGKGAKRTARLERWGAAVLAVEGTDAAETKRLADLMWTARRRRPRARYWSLPKEGSRPSGTGSAAGAKSAAHADSAALARLVSKTVASIRKHGRRDIKFRMSVRIQPPEIKVGWVKSADEEKLVIQLTLRGKPAIPYSLPWKKLPARDVYHVARLYLDAPTREDHLALAELCRRAGMREQAAEHLKRARGAK